MNPMRYLISFDNDFLALEPCIDWDIEPTPEAIAIYGESYCYVGRTLEELDEAWSVSAANDPDDSTDDLTRQKIRRLIREQRSKNASLGIK